MHSTTAPIQDIINRRVETGLADLLLTVFDAGYCAALGSPPEVSATHTIADLLTMLAARHRDEVLAARGWLGLEPPLTTDELPGWLLRLPQQAAGQLAAVEAVAAIERVNALGDAQPPAAWLKRGAP